MEKTDSYCRHCAINRANELNAKAVLDMSNQQYDNLWQYYADTMEWAWTSAESEQERIKDLAVANLDKEAREYQAQLQQHLKVVRHLEV